MKQEEHKVRGDTPFWASLACAVALYLGLILVMLATTATYTQPGKLWAALASPEIRHSFHLSIFSCTVSSLIALAVAVPVGYLTARGRFSGKNWLDAALDIPIVLPPMVIGLCLLSLFQTPPARALEKFITFTYAVNGVILAQFIVGAAFAVRTMRSTFEDLPARPEDVAMTLGCSRAEAVWRVTLPSARPGMFAAFSVAWARSLGEFGPILVFAGATRMRTEVLPTTVWLELSVGNLEAAIAVSILMVAMAMLVLAGVRWAGRPI